jgi:hypothetical protein
MPQLYAHTADHTAYTALYGVYVYDDMIFWVIIRFLKTLTIPYTDIWVYTGIGQPYLFAVHDQAH